MSLPESITVEIRNWVNYNGRPDVKQPSWFRVAHSITEDQDFDHFSHEEFKAWLHILCLASKKNSGVVTIRYEHARRVCRLSRRGVDGAIRKLQELKILLASVTHTNAHVTSACATRQTDKTDKTDKTRQTWSFSEFWRLYPRKIAKSDALARFEALIGSQEDFGSLIEAVTRFRAHHESTGTDAKYIPHPATFLGTKAIPRWRDWLDAENGKSEIAGAGEFVGLKLPEARL